MLVTVPCPGVTVPGAAELERRRRRRVQILVLTAFADMSVWLQLKRGDSSASPKLDRYKMARQLTEKAIKDKKIFSIHGHYPVVRALLRRKGWVEKKLHFLPRISLSADGEGAAESKRPESKESQEVALEETDDIHDVMSRLVRNEVPYFLWTIKRDSIDYHSLSGDQMLNHYGKTASFTTKVRAGTRDGGTRKLEKAKISLDDCLACSGCVTSAETVLITQQSHEELRKILDANKACQACLGQREHEDIDVATDAATDLTEEQWKELTQQYYALIHLYRAQVDIRAPVPTPPARSSPGAALRPPCPLPGQSPPHPLTPAQPPPTLPLADIVCMDRVEEILELVASDNLLAKDKWVVQKYIETPLLIYDTKFDIRQWFLVTDWNPLTIWFYKESYLRFSTRRFSLDDLDGAIHLCNNSIQKHLKIDKGRSPLLPYHNMWTSARFQEYLQKRGRGSVWGSIIYPAMKQAVANTMKVAQDHVEPRKSSFELYGADFILGHDFKPWLIEINSSPTMHASTPVTAQLCAQVQEDTIKVVLDRKGDRNCDVGNFELLWKQSAVDLPPVYGSDLCVEGVSVRKGKKQMPPIPRFRFSPSLRDAPLKARGTSVPEPPPCSSV
ncbi:PREDICTED: protein monoglycylase TTLL8 [Myotis davidii]|uniref:protein monoglycylase TTLL8 n=1 Tax=Myotis davidii TaxID=225400 RepID=UPI000767C421|nr:PREDICTED: protein monoglycylase TTLL8 [Myotis davidii]